MCAPVRSRLRIWQNVGCNLWYIYINRILFRGGPFFTCNFRQCNRSAMAAATKHKPILLKHHTQKYTNTCGNSIGFSPHQYLCVLKASFNLNIHTLVQFCCCFLPVWSLCDGLNNFPWNSHHEYHITTKFDQMFLFEHVNRFVCVCLPYDWHLVGKDIEKKSI